MEQIERKREEIRNLLQEKQLKQITKILPELTAVDIADLLGPMDDATSLLVFRLLPKDLAVEVFPKLSGQKQADMFGALEDKEAKDIIEELYFDDIIDLLEEVPANITDKIIQYTDDEERGLVNQFLNYGPETAGGLMTIEYISVTEDMTVKEALAHIKEVGLDTQLIYTLYVVDYHRKLLGYVGLRQVVTSDQDVLIKDLMSTDLIRVHATDDQEEVANIFTRYGFVALPVVDTEERMVGVITVDDVLDVITKETTEDFQIIAGTSPTDEEYMSASTFELVKNRLPWLLLLMISATFTGRIMSRYEDVLATHAVLAMFIPMLMDTGGNSGSQSSTLVIRGLATGEVNVSDGLRVLWKEFKVGIVAGIALAGINYIRLRVFENINPPIAMAVSITLIVTLVLAKMVGGLLPIIAEKLRLDPAIMAGPLITTIVDAMALWVYFVISMRFIANAGF